MKTDNELIAEFMGLNPKGSNFFKGFQYDRSWDELMPVVDKIETIGTPENKKVKFVLKQDTKNQVSWNLTNGWSYNSELSCIHGKTKMETTYNAVVKFINWYNQNK